MSCHIYLLTYKSVVLASDIKMFFSLKYVFAVRYSFTIVSYLIGVFIFAAIVGKYNLVAGFTENSNISPCQVQYLHFNIPPHLDFFVCFISH